MKTEELTQAIKALAREQGAALVGIAPVERFDPMPPVNDTAPAGQHPRDFVPEARSVISFAMPILPAVLDAPAVLKEQDTEMVPEEARRPYYDHIYNRVGHVVHDVHLEVIGHRLGQLLLAEGFDAMVFPTTGVHPGFRGKNELEVWDASPFRYTSGPFSHRHAATRAGLGEFGLNNVVLTRAFGPRQRFNSVVTDAELEPDPLIDKPICLRKKCGLCVKACIMKAIELRTEPAEDTYRLLEADDHDRIFIDTPSRSYPRLCMDRPNAEFAPVRGDCLRICPIPKKPKRLPAHLKRLKPGI